MPVLFGKLKLHTQILVALILGALFGAVFHVDQTKLIISTPHESGVAEIELNNWSRIELTLGNQKQSFTTKETSKLLKWWNASSQTEREKSEFTYFEKGKTIPIHLGSVQDIRKESTLATSIKPLGTIFIRLLNLIAVPLVLASLIVGAASLGDIKRVARIGAKTLSYFLLTTALAISIGLVMANLVEPGKQVSEESRELLMAEYGGEVAAKVSPDLSIDIIDMIVKMVPTNPFSALAEGEMLQIVFFAVVGGVVLTFVREEKAKPVIQFFDGLSELMIEFVQLVMKIAPYAVFALIAATVSEFGFGIIQTLFWYVGTVLLGLAVHTFVVYPTLLKLFSDMSVTKFFRGIRPAQLVAFSTSSSAATLPVNFECCEKNLGVPKSITSFVLPLGATINMDGTALYQGVAAVFIAQVYGFDLNFTHQLTIVLTATLASIGTAPVPGVGIIMLVIVLKSINVPEEGIALILGVDRFLDMCRTVPNVTGDATGSVIMWATEQKIRNTR
jgi:Na+/H+-dicarboxylate symporter